MARRVGKRDWTAIAWPTAVVLLWITMMERAVHALFVVSLAALGVSPTLLAIPLLFSGFIYPLGLHKRCPHSQRLLLATTFIALAAILATIIAPGSVAVIAAAISILALTVLLFDVVARLGTAMVMPCVLGVLLTITLRTINDTAPLGLTHRGIVLTIIVAVIAGVLRWTVRNDDAPRDAAMPVAGAGVVVAFLLIQFQLLAVPSAAATLHSPHPLNDAWWYFALLLSCQLGLLIGLRLSSKRMISRVGIAIVHVGAVALLVTGIAYGAAPLCLLVAQATAVMLLASGLSAVSVPVRRAGMRTGTLQVIWWLLVVLHAFSSKWPFLPSALRPMLEGKAGIYLMISFAIFPIAVLLEARRRES